LNEWGSYSGIFHTALLLLRHLRAELQKMDCFFATATHFSSTYVFLYCPDDCCVKQSSMALAIMALGLSTWIVLFAAFFAGERYDNAHPQEDW
jgi:hypothetical protein